MTYVEALGYIHSISWKGSVPGLERITELCERLGNVQERLRFVHVAGTNGKGSVSAMVSSVLKAAGYRTGLFTSPYLVDFRERMQIDNVPISEEELCRSVERVRPAADAMADSPTEFELITAVAFDYFAREGCDVVVLECGMGGRLDSTNVISTPDVAVITNIALDHTEFLGDSVEKIAAEKAGIIKDGGNVVLGGVCEGALEVFHRTCRERGARLCLADGELGDVRFTPDGMSFVYDGAELFIPLCGLYQRTNATTALAALEVLRSVGYGISREALCEGLSSVRWQGRFETLCRSPRVIFDGAHNPDGAAYTASTFAALYPGERAVIVSGVMKDKDSAEMAKSFASVGACAFTLRPDNPRAMDAVEYASVLREAGLSACPCGSVSDALEKALARARELSCPVLCAGSLYMYGEIAEALRRLTDGAVC